MAELDVGILIGQVILGLIVLGIFLSGIRIIRPTNRAAIESLGKYTRFQKSGITFIIPFIQKMYSCQYYRATSRCHASRSHYKR